MTKLELRRMAAKIAPTSYLSATDYLAAVYKELKAQIPAYSYIRFTEDLGFGACNAMFLIIHGKRPLTEKGAEKIVVALDLAGNSRKYFLEAVKVQRLADPTEREAAFSRLVELKTNSMPRALDKRQLEFFTNWYNAAVLEMLGLEDVSDDPAWLATHLMPPVPPSKVKGSLELLKKLGLIVFDAEKKRFVPSQIDMSSGGEVPGLAIVRYHQQMISLAKDALTDIPATKRDISGVTISIEADKMEEIKQKIAAFRKELLQYAREAKTPDEVVQINIQVFPIGEIPSRSKRDEAV